MRMTCRHVTKIIFMMRYYRCISRDDFKTTRLHARDKSVSDRFSRLGWISRRSRLHRDHAKIRLRYAMNFVHGVSGPTVRVVESVFPVGHSGN